MLRIRISISSLRFALIFGVLALLAAGARAQGIALPAVGAINQSMGGASVAAPLDAMSALYWNPAGIGALPSSEMSFGLGLLLPTTRVASSIPLFGMAGNDGGEPGVMPIPSAAFVFRDEDSPFTYGVGMYGIGGFATNYPGNAANPVLAPPPIGQGNISAAVEILQIAPTVSVLVTEQLTLGFTPTVNLARLAANPSFLSAPDDAAGGGPTYPPGSSTRYTWGFGGHVGAFWTGPNGVNLGASIKSPQWFEKFRANSRDELGRPRTLTTSFDFPMIVSLGGSYTGYERWVFAADVRYFDYSHTDGFRATGYNADGSVAGLGWKDIYAVASGAQFQVAERFFLRMGYAYNTNPIGDNISFFNVPSPLITQHVASLGSSFEFAPGCLASLSYSHAFENSGTGPIILPAGPVPTSSVTNFTSADLLIATMTVRF